MNNIIKSVIFLAVIALASCKAERPIITDTDRNVTHTEVIRKVDITTEADTATAIYRIVYKANPDSTQKGMPQQLVLEKVGEMPGKHLKAPKVAVKDGQLIITAIAEQQTIPVEVKDTYIHEKESKKTTEVIVKNELTASQSVRVWIGNIVIVLLVALVVVQILRVKKVLKF